MGTKMNKITVAELVQQHCRLTKQWAVVLYPNNNSGFEELLKAVPFLEHNDDLQAIADELMIVLCSSEDECWQIFNQIRGDDMPENNNYNGPCRVYAWTCGSNGEIQTENT